MPRTPVSEDARSSIVQRMGQQNLVKSAVNIVRALILNHKVYLVSRTVIKCAQCDLQCEYINREWVGPLLELKCPRAGREFEDTRISDDPLENELLKMAQLGLVQIESVDGGIAPNPTWQTKWTTRSKSMVAYGDTPRDAVDLCIRQSNDFKPR